MLAPTWIHSSSYTSENIVKLQFRKLNKIICKNKKPSPVWEEDEEDKVMLHNSLFAQTINVKKDQWDKKVGAAIGSPQTSDARPYLNPFFILHKWKYR